MNVVKHRDFFSVRETFVIKLLGLLEANIKVFLTFTQSKRLHKYLLVFTDR